MKASIDHVRELAGKNAALMHVAAGQQEKILDAAEAEAERLGKIISSTKPADVITDEAKSIVYQKQVGERASLQRLLAERHA